MGPGRRRDGAGDGELAARASQGDEAAFQELYRRHAPRLFSLARAVLGDRSLAEEAVQEAFVAVWRNLRTYDPGLPFSAWVTHIAHTKVVDLLRRRRRAQAHRAPVEAESVLAAVPDPAPGPEQQSEARARGERVRAALAGLPPTQREVLVLAYFAGCTHEEIARRTGRPLGTVKTWIRAGLEALRATLEDP